jgi:hypothetical protein
MKGTYIIPNQERRALNNIRFAHAVLRRLKYLHHIYILFMQEITGSARLPLRHSLRAWSKGFTRLSYRLYGLDAKDDSAGYLSDFQMIKQIKCNGIFTETVSNKLTFALLMKQFRMPQPEVHGLIRNGVFYPINSNPNPSGANSLSELLNTSGKLVLKPIKAAHGYGFIKLELTDQGLRLNGNEISLRGFEQLAAGLDDYLVTGFVVQGGFAAALYPHTTNTIRIITMWDVDQNQPFIAASVQRIGTSRSFPVDNFKAGEGGLSALVDHESGRLGPGARAGAQGDVSWHDSHPETQALIKGQKVPAWSQVKQSILRFAAHFPFVPCIAWDIVPLDSGFSIIEGNSIPGMPVIQVHGPVLQDDRIRKFYKCYGVIK